MGKTTVVIGSGIVADVAASGSHVIIVIDGEPYVFPGSTARELARALTEAAQQADDADAARVRSKAAHAETCAMNDDAVDPSACPNGCGSL